MPDTNEPEKLTYTLNSDISFYEKESGCLNVLLPAEDITNPYVFTLYDISQITNGIKYNGLFVFMRKTIDTGDDLDGDPSKTEYCYNFNFSDIVSLQNYAGFSAFDSLDENVDSLVIIYHDNLEEDIEKLSCAQKIFEILPVLISDINTNGNSLQTMELISGKHRKIGMSTIPRK